ncbi:MAG TPA: efflux RND transporter periplasmic adaptor subunit [Chryseosolibacter sp.]
MDKIALYIVFGLSVFFTGCIKESHDDDLHRAHQEDEANQNAVSLAAAPTNRRIISSQALVRPVRRRQSAPVHAYGFVSPDERRSNQVSVRVGGRVETLYVKYENQLVRKGEKILDLYSPDLNTYQEELLYAHKVDPGGELEKDAARKLQLLGVTAAQVARIIVSGKTSVTLSIYSPYNGYIFYGQPTPVPPAATGIASSIGRNKMEGMGSGSGPSQPAPAPMSASVGPIREGAYVSAGQTLFWINDLSEVWGILSVDNLHQDEIALNDSVTVVSELTPGDSINTVVRFIEPQYAAGQKFIQVRVYLPNRSRDLRVNSLLEGTIHPKAKEALTLPASSILYLGGRQAVWRKAGQTEGGAHILQIEFIRLGSVSAGRVTVVSGLDADDEVARDAGLLVDRESLVGPD